VRERGNGWRSVEEGVSNEYHILCLTLAQVVVEGRLSVAYIRYFMTFSMSGAAATELREAMKRSLGDVRRRFQCDDYCASSFAPTGGSSFLHQVSVRRENRCD